MAARGPWPCSAVAADLCALNVPQPGSLAMTLSWQLDSAPPARCTAVFGPASKTGVPVRLEAGSPDAGVPGQRTRPRAAISSCRETTAVLVSSCPHELFAPVFSDLAARWVPSLPVESTGAPPEAVDGVRPEEQSKILHLQWLVLRRPLTGPYTDLPVPATLFARSALRLAGKR